MMRRGQDLRMVVKQDGAHGGGGGGGGLVQMYPKSCPCQSVDPLGIISVSRWNKHTAHI